MKTYTGTVHSRSRLTIPFDCWMDAQIKRGLKIWTPEGRLFEFDQGVCMTKNLSYRITCGEPFKKYAPGTKIEMIPNSTNHCIDLRIA